MNDGIMRPMNRPAFGRGIMLLLLAAGIAGCQLLPFGDRMPDPASPAVDRSQAAESTQVPLATSEAEPTAPPASETAAGEPSPSLEIPPPID